MARRRSAWCVLMLVAAGCAEADVAPTRPCTRTEVGQRWSLLPPADLDLLLVLDTAGSAGAASRLTGELPWVIEALLDGDLDRDGYPESHPVRSLHLGVVTADLGAGPTTGVPTCAVGLGDDGVLRRCEGSPSGVFEITAGEERASIVEEVRCAASVGADGCSYTQPLESALEALSPAFAQPWTAPGYVPPRFTSADGVPDSMAGQGERENTGFLRSSTDLAIVILTDQDDCSTRDHDLFSPEDARYASLSPTVRCAAYGAPVAGLLHPIARYVEGLGGLRRDPRWLTLSVIAGIPPELEPARGEPPDFDAILAHPSMTPTPDATGVRLEPSCATTEGSALAPVRIVETARALAAVGARVSVSSICRDDLAPALEAFLAQVAAARTVRTCVWNAPAARSDGRVDCGVYELLPEEGPSSECARVPGRELVELVTSERGGPRELCRVAQLDRATASRGEAPGWYLDDFSDAAVEDCGGAAIVYTRAGRPPRGAETRVECARTVGLAGSGWLCDEHTFGRQGCLLEMGCDLATDRCATGTTRPDHEGIVLACDPVDEVCAAPCTTDADCVEGGLPGFVCDRRTNAEAAEPLRASELPEALRTSPRDVCVHPTCR